MGRTFRPEYRLRRPDGSVELRKQEWFVEYKDASGRIRRQKVGPSKVRAEEILRKLEGDTALEKAGLPTQKAAQLPLLKLRDDYLQSQDGRVVPDHLASVRHRISEVLEGTRAFVVRDLTPERMEGFLAQMSQRNPAPAARTLNTYLIAVKGMLNWAVDVRLIPYNTLACVKPRSERVKAIRRRALTEDEVARLLRVALTAPLDRQRSRAKHPVPLRKQAELLEEGTRFALVWRILIYTGLRCGELDALRWQDLDLQDGTLTVRAETAKSGRSDVLPVPGHLVRALQAWKERTQGRPEQPVVALHANMARRLREDLKSADIPHRDESGRTVDAHALRHTAASLLVKSGADIKTVQNLLRHSTPSLTLAIYAHSSAERMRQAVEALPEPCVPQAHQTPVPTARAG